MLLKDHSLQKRLQPVARKNISYISLKGTHIKKAVYSSSEVLSILHEIYLKESINLYIPPFVGFLATFHRLFGENYCLLLPT